MFTSGCVYFVNGVHYNRLRVHIGSIDGWLRASGEELPPVSPSPMGSPPHASHDGETKEEDGKQQSPVSILLHCLYKPTHVRACVKVMLCIISIWI